MKPSKGKNTLLGSFPEGKPLDLVGSGAFSLSSPVSCQSFLLDTALLCSFLMPYLTSFHSQAKAIPVPPIGTLSWDRGG